jgi:hypothetical protein
MRRVAVLSNLRLEEMVQGSDPPAPGSAWRFVPLGERRRLVNIFTELPIFRHLPLLSGSSRLELPERP